MPTVDWSLKENSDRLLAAVWEAIPDRKVRRSQESTVISPRPAGTLAHSLRLQDGSIPNCYFSLMIKIRHLGLISISNKKRQLDYKRVAQLYGHGATYNSIECRFRPIRKLGEKLRDEAPLAQNGAGTAPSTTSRKPRAPKKDLGKDDSKLLFLYLLA